MSTLAIILGRAGSKGLPHKNILPLAGKPMVAWTIDHALHSQRVDTIVLSSDSAEMLALARERGIAAVTRPPELATDTATVDDAARHAVRTIEAQLQRTFETFVILYANVPIRPADLTDRAVQKLAATGCDSVQSVCPVGKMHPYWMKKLAGPDGDILQPNVENNIYRRQDLPPLYMLDGGIIAVTRAALFTQTPGQPHAFLGTHRRAILTQPGTVVDVDSPIDLAVAQAILAV
jgi:CMP-N,N'-diacetyllegionaminic acid synthase